MFPRICMPLVGAALMAGCTSSATLSNGSGGPADSTASASPPSPLSTVLDPSIAATEMAPTQTNAAVDSSKDPTASMGDMKGMKMSGMGANDNVPSAPPANGTHEMQGMQGMQMPGMKGMDQPQSQPATTQAAVIYTCSMHPQIQQDHPGNCPICGMTLIKKETAAASQKGVGQ